jgi:pyruvate/2-oxoglutarate dehydrogenase complex dihydrolipoamide dehydrogenase (E3) component
MSQNPNEPRTFVEEITVAGNQMTEQIQKLVAEGNIRRLIIRDSSGRTLLEVPLTLGVVGGASVAIFAPFLAALGALAVLVTRVNLIVERYDDPADAERESAPSVAEIQHEKPKNDTV